MISVKNTTDQPELISARALRLVIGILALMLPTILTLGATTLGGCEEVQNSISAYYHTVMRNFFVGTLCAVSVCLFAYQGYSKTDRIAGKLAALFALGVAWCPTSVGAPYNNCIPERLEFGLTSTLHFVSAGLLFLLLAFFSIVLFTKHKGQLTKRKILRNRIYKICGYTILGCIAGIALYSFYLDTAFPDLVNYKPVFYLEAIALVAFSFSWLLKGEIIFGDK